MKKIYLLVFTIIFFSISIKSQFIKRIENIELLVWNTYKHEIINDSVTNIKFSVNQKTFDSNNLLIIERIFDENTHNQLYYITYFYDSLKRTKSIEKYNALNNKPIELLQIFYKNTNDTDKIIYYCQADKNIIPCKEKIFEYNNKNKLIAKKLIDLSTKKTINIEKIYYLKNGAISKISGAVISQSKQNYKIIYDYDKNNNLIKITYLNKNDKMVSFFNSKNKPVKIEYYKNDQLDKIVNFYYEGDIELKQVAEYDKNKKLEKFYSINYYYHKITSLNLKSHFEGN